VVNQMGLQKPDLFIDDAADETNYDQEPVMSLDEDDEDDEDVNALEELVLHLLMYGPDSHFHIAIIM
jgi:hypothetical protein